MKNYKNAFTEVYEILNSLEEEDFKKIPKDVIEVLEKNRNREYEYFLDESLELFAHPMLPETKAILFNLFRDYLCTEQQRASIVRMQREEREKNEKRKSLQYRGNELFAGSVVKAEKVECELPVEVKGEGLWQRILGRIRGCFVK